MALIFADRVKDTASGVSGSTVTLSNSAPTGFQGFNAGIGDANACVYCISDTAGNWEISYGVYTNSGATLARASTPIASSNSGAQVSSFSGTISVFVTDPAANASIPITGLKSGNLYSNYLAGTATTNNSQATGLVRYAPVLIGQWFTSVTIHFNIGTLAAGSGTTAIGLYSNANGQPNKRLVQATGLISGNQGGGATGANNSGSLNLPSPQPPGLYWVALVTQTTAPSLQTFAPAAGANLIGAKHVMGITDITTANFNALMLGWTESGTTLPSTATPSALPTIIPIVGVAAVT